MKLYFSAGEIESILRDYVRTNFPLLESSEFIIEGEIDCRELEDNDDLQIFVYLKNKESQEEDRKNERTV